MINYGKTQIQTSSDSVVKVISEMWLSYENTDIDAMTVGTPAYWDETLLSILGSSYAIYELYFKKIPLNKCNSVTDHKMVWGLLGLQKGLFSSQLDVGDFRLYFGLTSITPKQFLSSDACAFLALPVEEKTTVKEVWAALVEALRDNNGMITQSISIAVKERSGAIGIYYSCFPDAELTLICNNSHNFAKKLNAIQFPPITIPHYRAFWNL